MSAAVACWIMPSGGLACWCEHCSATHEAGAWHFHGRGDSPLDARTFGPRVAHCVHRALPGRPRASSYELVNLGEATQLVLKAIRKRHPPPEEEVCRALGRAIDKLNRDIAQLAREVVHRRPLQRKTVTTEFTLPLD